MIIPIIALALLPVCTAVIFARRRILIGKLGKCETEFPHRMQFQFIGIMVCTPVLIALNFFRPFDALTMFAISGTGVLGFCVALTDIMLIRSGGIYEHGLVWNTVEVFYGSIASFSLVDPFSIELTENDGNRRMLTFVDQNQASLVYSRLEFSAHPLP